MLAGTGRLISFKDITLANNPILKISLLINDDAEFPSPDGTTRRPFTQYPIFPELQISFTELIAFVNRQIIYN